MSMLISSLIKGNKYYILLLLVVLILIVFTFVVKTYFSSTISSKWDQISLEKTKEVSTKCLNNFYSYQNELEAFTSKVTSDKRFASSIKSQNIKKAYDALFDINGSAKYNLEVYNSRFELVLYNGRQLYPEILELKKAIEGPRFSTVKEIGLFTFLIIYEPIKDEAGNNEGVIAASSILDVNQEVQNTFLGSKGITREIFDSYNMNVSFAFDQESYKVSPEEPQSTEYNQVELKGVDGNKIGKINLPSLDKDSYLNSINNKFNNLTSFFLFIASVILLIWIKNLAEPLRKNLAKGSIIFFALLAARYFWLFIEFPSKFFADLNSEFFSPNFYASGFGFGIAKSLGELIITSAVLLISAYVILKYIIANYQKDQNTKKNIFVVCVICVGLVGVIFASIQLYGNVAQSIIYDSTIKFVDKTDIFSFNQPELVLARLTLLINSITLLFIIFSAGLMIIIYLNPYLTRSKIMRKYSVLLLTLILAAIIPLFTASGNEFSLFPGSVLLIIMISGLFMFYLVRKLNTTRNFDLVNVSVLSLLLLSTTIFIPVIVLAKITAQENSYLEKAARDISQRNDDKISFLVTSTINELLSNEQIQADIKNKNKAGNLAFSLWSSSSLNDEDVNSAVFVLDSSKKLVSDFNLIPTELNRDSVIKYVLKEYKTNISKYREEEEEQITDTAVNTSIMTTTEPSYIGETGLIQNKENKYYAAISEIVPSPSAEIRNLQNPGYIVVVCSYDSRNYMRQSILSLLKSYTRENIYNKLTSAPVFSEFSDDELVGSSNNDVSKAFIKSLPAFRESVKDKPVKSALRYDQFENESYKSFYILSESRQNMPEKIYVVSVKVNDFALSSFFYFRYLLFSAFVFVIIMFFYTLWRLFLIIFKWQKMRVLKFGFREKLFVSFLVASVMPIIILALYTREYVITKNEESYNNQLISDLRLIEQYVKNRLQLNVKIEKEPDKDNTLSFADVFGRELSQSNKNFNLYFRNKIAATTSEQLYKSDLLDTRLSGHAYYNIALLKKDFYTESQQIGDFTFIVGYKPLFDRYNYLSGIISTQTVFKQNEINQELTESLIYIFGPYIAAVIILVFVVNVLSYRISNPILKLQKATEQLSKGLTDIEVKSSSKDEIGELVMSFNRMVKELKRAQEELKIAERETAWRDIARQVAHEIKNPLTPMMLAMQHLFKAYSSGSKNFEKIMKSTNKMIIDQIESLNKIATEFSNFARLPGKNYETLDLDEILKDVAELMNTKRNIELKLAKSGSHKVIGDKDELKRALLNIVKNSVQAIEENTYVRTEGKVVITAEQKDGLYCVSINDNGVGMDKHTIGKLFEPYFSTKSSGMGLGLVISKKILDDMKARIHVKSEEGKGTSVEILFRIKE